MAYRFVPESFSRVWNWLNFADYDSAKEQGVLDVIARYARGNVSSQNGWVLDKVMLGDLATMGDQAAKNLKNKVSAH